MWQLVLSWKYVPNVVPITPMCPSHCSLQFVPYALQNICYFVLIVPMCPKLSPMAAHYVCFTFFAKSSPLLAYIGGWQVKKLCSILSWDCLVFGNFYLGNVQSFETIFLMTGSKLITKAKIWTHRETYYSKYQFSKEKSWPWTLFKIK